ncbi:MAG: hypothetical protein IJO43_01350 [Bacilli bacterium]|nr:hypothetical protein [Bacilli bacterium]
MGITSWIVTQIRGLFASITYCVYALIETIMQGIFDIANLRLTEGLIGDIHKRIYVFLGIFMVFKLTVSLLQYMVNPEALTDKSTGINKLIVRTFVMLALLIWLPMQNIGLFPLLHEAQDVFIPVLPKIILGQPSDNSSTVSSNAELLASAALGAFYSPCTECDESDRPDPIDNIDDMMETYGDKADGVYAYEFNFIFAIAVGVIVVIILLSVTIKIGIRLFKMFLLEMLAPIPVMSYIDPKSAKDGAFASWVKQLTTTFLDLFIRLGVIYIVLYLLSALANDNLLDPSTLPTNFARKAYLMVFLIIALLMFAKDAPHFIQDALGIKHDKDTSGFLAGATGFITGGATGAISGAISGRGLRGAVTGAAAGASAGFQGGMTGKKASAWSAGGDAAIQGRTGDPKAKSGILAALQSSASKAQLAREGRKLNLTDATLADAKQNMIDMQALAAEAQRNWEVGLHTGNFVDLNGVPMTGPDAMERAAQIVAETSTASTIATKNYEKANKAGDAYGINRSFAEDYKKDKKDARVSYKRGGMTKQQYKAKGQFNPEKGKIDR